jgi:hypothetical protein
VKRAGLVAATLLFAAGAAHAEAPPPFAKSARPPFALEVTAFVGDGLRFNNPYRLATVLGSDAESVSRTSVYVDLGAAALFGDPRSFLHGLALRTSIGLEGVPETTLTPSYQLFRRFGPTAAWVRLGTPIVLTAPTWGLEGALGGAWFVRAGIGVTAELVFDAIFGTGTRASRVTTYPVASAQLGLIFHWEVLP